MQHDYIIIGAGITGVALGRLLQMKGTNNFVILESENEAGGLCRTKNINGHIFDLAGGHFFDSNFPEVLDFVFNHLPQDEFNIFGRVSKIEIHGKIINYPIEINLWQLPKTLRQRYVASLKKDKAAGEFIPRNFEEYSRINFGDLITENYIIPYNRKLWGAEPSFMDVDWLHKIPSTNMKDILDSLSRKKSDLSKIPSHAKFRLPKRGGFQAIFDSIYKKVADHVVLGCKVKSIKRERGRWLVNGRYLAKTAINTAPWPVLFKALGAPAELKKDFDNLKSNSLVVSLFQGPKTGSWQWLYVPDEKKEYHRKFLPNNFYPHSRQDGLWRETNLSRWPGKNGKWSDGAKPVFEHVNEFAYPVPTLGHAKAIRKILDYYEPKNLFGLGRWGRWSYKNADVCIYDCIKLADKLCSK